MRRCEEMGKRENRIAKIEERKSEKTRVVTACLEGARLRRVLRPYKPKNPT